MAHADNTRYLRSLGFTDAEIAEYQRLEDRENDLLDTYAGSTMTAGALAEIRAINDRLRALDRDRCARTEEAYQRGDTDVTGTPMPPVEVVWNWAAATCATDAGYTYVHVGYRRNPDGSYAVALAQTTPNAPGTASETRRLRLEDGPIHLRLSVLHGATEAWGATGYPRTGPTAARLAEAQAALQRLLRGPRAEQRREVAAALLPVQAHAADAYDALTEERHHVILRIRMTHILGTVRGPRVVAMERALGRPVWGTKQLSASECGRVHAWLDAKYGPAAGRPHVADAA